jgi:trans-aconitate methyltransferase
VGEDGERLDQRIPEPELMEDPAQAAAYAAADFAAAHDALVRDLLDRHPGVRDRRLRVVDLGCGPADVTVRLARALPGATIAGVDAGPAMLGHGRDRVRDAHLAERVVLHLARVDAALGASIGPADLVVSNSLLHHLRDPGDLWAAVAALAVPGTLVHVADLSRPVTSAEVDDLVAREAAGEPEVLREDFRRSLRAAYRPAEVEDQLRRAGLLGALHVTAVPDRHLVVWGQL